MTIPLAAYAGRDLSLSFAIRDYFEENNEEDGVYFSDNGGESFQKVYGFDAANWTNSYGQLPPFDLDALAEANGLRHDG